MDISISAQDISCAIQCYGQQLTPLQKSSLINHFPGTTIQYILTQILFLQKHNNSLPNLNAQEQNNPEALFGYISRHWFIISNELFLQQSSLQFEARRVVRTITVDDFTRLFTQPTVVTMQM
jgi:hypothetical protein